MKNLYRSTTDRKLSGVLGGLSDYLGMDASLLRILFVIVGVFTAFLPLAIIYVAWIFLVPEESEVS
ncbi:PspC domain-containing protein [Metabacillus litoralis]|uniref:PspC domain-containing protein n=1 Tax=Metabacillus litoralis TaxID=152268 RepID=A0A5C6VZM9_9BACI|nr:PspC domain-containing protein [Metabacillus litoralis]TXC91038.1 PspC domain-containing protein [Metabacillus litoralis]